MPRQRGKLYFCATARITGVKKPKKAKSRARAKRKGEVKSVEEYLARVPEPARTALQRMRAAIRSVLPREAEEIISYGIPAFRLQKVVVWFAAFSDHCSLFPTAAAIEKFKGELKGFSTSKGTIHFPNEKRLPIKLIKKIVKARAAQVKTARPR